MRRLIIIALVSCLHCQTVLQDSRLTPGVVDPNLTKAVICDPDWHTSMVRHTSDSTKKRVCRVYQAQGKCPGKKYELDHLVPLEIGGADMQGNLWPQPIKQARMKDKLENRLHRMVCNDEISLEDAQECIATDWYQCGIKVGLWR